jgi:serine phosphatase RsbU (regulator of sigma subunit)
MRIVLECRIAEGEERWDLAEGRHSLGRGPENTIQVADRSVSRLHAEIVVGGGRIEVRDLGSRNGTWINGRPLSAPGAAEPGDRIRFGAVEARIMDLDAPARREGFAGALLSQAEEIGTSVQLRWEDVQQAAHPGADREWDLLRVVAEAGQLVVLPRPIEGVLETVLELLARVIPARRILLLLREGEDGPLDVRASRPPGSEARRRLMLSRTIVDTVLTERTSMLVTDAQADPRFSGQMSIVEQDVHSAIVAPLFDNERVIGLVYADTSNPLVRYDEDQLRALAILANLAAVKISNLRLLEHERERERMEQEMATAARIQRSLLPSNPPEVEGYEFAARQEPCFQVGGDLYDAIPLADGRTAFVLGDVSGKGMGAALLMSHVMASLQVLAEERVALPLLMGRLHRQVLRSSDHRRFATLFIGALDRDSHRLEYVSAGHNPALLLHEGTPAWLEATGLPVGLVDEATYTANEVEILPGAILAVFSDGITEAMRGGELYGEERFAESVVRRAGGSLEEMADGVLEDLRAFLGPERPGDDITLLLVRRARAGARSKGSHGG